MLTLLIFFLLFFAIALVLPTVRVWRQTGINPVVLPLSDDVAGFVGTWFKLLIFTLGLYLALGSLGLLAPVGEIQLPIYATTIGWCLLALSICWVVIAQFQMGKSWRVGIDTHVKTELVIHGLFRISRNPIFLGMMVQLLGLFLVHPDAITLTVFLAAYILISIQIRGEEEHLRALHPDSYSAYSGAVRRWL
jgi:protein-S-isoprenylcysteine O-methyltransferase Ste14